MARVWVLGGLLLLGCGAPQPGGDAGERSPPRGGVRCEVDADCGPARPLCGSGTGRCVACFADEDCAAGVCDVLVGDCVACLDEGCTVRAP